MPVCTLDVPQLPYSCALVTAYRGIEDIWPNEPELRLFPDVRYEVGSALTTALQNHQLGAQPILLSAALMLAEKSLEDWLRPEEDEAWAHLQ